MKEDILQRIERLRDEMKRERLSAFIFTSADAHNSEYTPDRWHGREWISGFNGSAGTAVVTLDDAALWTDSRYFLAAREQLAGTGFTLMKDGMAETPEIAEWLGKKLAKADGAEVGIDGYCLSQSDTESLRKKLRHQGGITLRTNLDILNRIWNDRPAMPDADIFIHDVSFCGLSAKEKLRLIREELKKKHACGLLITALDEVAWTLNLRGHDVHCTPVFLAYLLIDGDETTLFIDRKKLTADVADYLRSQGVAVADYCHIEKALENYQGYNILLDPEQVNGILYNKVHCQEVIADKSPVLFLKSIKNDTEISCIRNAMIKDGVALVKFLKWMTPAVAKGGQTEISLDEKLTEFKKEQQLFEDLSFDTIAAYKEHGAIVHYEATPETASEIKPEGLLLIDCGSQYQDGTTDITRTFALGSITDEEKRVCTLVMKAHINLARAQWLEGTNGTQLDVLARGELWKEGYSYGHGTGHGVGFFLSCHEGPQCIRKEYRPAPLLPGVVITDEPGIYLEGKFGCRIENMLLVVPAGEGVQGDRFCKFETLTLCPYDKGILNIDMLTQDEIDWINHYHRMVYEKLSPHLNDEEREWLMPACAAIIKGK